MRSAKQDIIKCSIGYFDVMYPNWLLCKFDNCVLIDRIYEAISVVFQCVMPDPLIKIVSCELLFC